MLKIYLYEGWTRQYEEGTQPEGAVEVKRPQTKAKAKEGTKDKVRREVKNK